MKSHSRTATVAWATFGHVASPMGLQHYESQLLSAIAALGDVKWRFETKRFGGFRARSTVDVRVPHRVLDNAPSAVVRAIGAAAFRNDNVHRFDLRLPPAKAGEIVTVHDLPPLRFPDEGRLPTWATASARRASLIICPSNFAAKEVSELLGASRIEVIPNGVGQDFLNPIPLETPDLHALGILGPYVLHAGGASMRKNLHSLADAWRSAAPSLRDHQLVLVGPPDERRDIAFAGAQRVVKVGYRPPSMIARLMVTADAVVVPSLYEGFGLPALEALTVGTPLLSSSCGALPEVCGDAALLVAPTASALAEGLLTLVNSPGLQASLRARGLERSRLYSWESSARAHVSCYDKIFR